MSASFGTRLSEAMRQHGPLCAGIDAHPGLLAEAGMPDTAESLRRFTGVMTEAVAGRVAAVKPQSAFFERHGSAGVAVLEDLLTDLASAGTICVLDVKRGDIGSTMTAYAQAYLGPDAPLVADAITISPYLGFGSLTPALTLARESARGAFVLTLTSNPEGAEVQHRGSPSVAASIVAHVADHNAAASHGAAGALGHVGLVIGASQGPVLDTLGLRESVRSSGAPILAPGLGAQGASAAELAVGFAGLEDRVLAPVSRGLLSGGVGVDAVRERTRAFNDELRASLGI
ncbi:MAG: orotidine-5'-phosphate decarboxylase [Ornithinimicrobium sp.]